MEIPAGRGQDFVWCVEQRNKTYLKFDASENRENVVYSYLPIPPLGQDMTQGQFLSEVEQVWM